MRDNTKYFVKVSVLERIVQLSGPEYSLGRSQAVSYNRPEKRLMNTSPKVTWTIVTLLTLNSILLGFLALRPAQLTATPAQAAGTSRDIVLTMDDLVAVALSDHELIEAIGESAFAKGDEQTRQGVVHHWVAYSFQGVYGRMSSRQQDEFRAKLLKAAIDLADEREFRPGGSPSQTLQRDQESSRVGFSR